MKDANQKRSHAPRSINAAVRRSLKTGDDIYVGGTHYRGRNPEFFIDKKGNVSKTRPGIPFVRT
jgi:hypothetical protein